MSPKYARTNKLSFWVYSLHLQYTFGGCNLHLHQFDVTGLLKSYKSQSKKGAIKKPGKDMFYIHRTGHRTKDEPGARFLREKTGNSFQDLKLS